MFTTGQPVVMYKELHNKYDSNATLVRTNTGTVLGYVPRTHNGRIADNAHGRVSWLSPIACGQQATVRLTI